MVRSEDYWDIMRPLSYNCLYNFFIGPRGTGKTYGSLKYCIEQYLKWKAKECSLGVRLCASPRRGIEEDH